MLCTLISAIILFINIQVGLNMHLYIYIYIYIYIYVDIGDASSSLRGSTSSFHSISLPNFINLARIKLLTFLVHSRMKFSQINICIVKVIISMN